MLRLMGSQESDTTECELNWTEPLMLNSKIYTCLLGCFASTKVIQVKSTERLRLIPDKQKTAYEMLACDWSSDVCSSDLEHEFG